MDKKITIVIAVAVITALCFGNPLAFAKKGDAPEGFGKGEKKGWGEATTPPGWSKGEKKGWNDAEVPPGLEEYEGGDE